MDEFIGFFRPWDPSLPTMALCATVGGLYLLGLMRGAAPGVWRVTAFLAGLALMYGALQTRVDYYAQFLFFGHRAQHLILHHLAPYLIALSAPASVLAMGLPSRVRASAIRGRLRPWLAPARTGYRRIQTPLIAGGLFVGLLYFWLLPSIHFDAMLSRDLYWIMNWSMALSGLLFWWLICARDPGGATPCLPLGHRVALLALVVPPQVLIGFIITFSERNLYEVYAICGRAFPITPLHDQQLGGLITWIPAVMMSVLAALRLLAVHLMATDRRAATVHPSAETR